MTNTNIETLNTDLESLQIMKKYFTPGTQSRFLLDKDFEEPSQFIIKTESHPNGSFKNFTLPNLLLRLVVENGPILCCVTQSCDYLTIHGFPNNEENKKAITIADPEILILDGEIYVTSANSGTHLVYNLDATPELRKKIIQLAEDSTPAEAKLQTVYISSHDVLSKDEESGESTEINFNLQYYAVQIIRGLREKRAKLLRKDYFKVIFMNKNA